MPMSWLDDLDSVLSALMSATANSQPENDNPGLDARRNRVAEVLARHPALADLLPTSNNWCLYSLANVMPCTTERLLATLIDRLLDTANHIGIEPAARTLERLLSDAEKHDLPGFDLTFFRDLKLTGRWDIAPGLYVLPFPMLEQLLRRRAQPMPDSLQYRIDPGHEQSVAVLVSEIRWGPVIVSDKGRTPSYPYPLEMNLVFNHDPLLLVALMAVTLQHPLWILLKTSCAEPWVDDFLGVWGGGITYFPSPTQLWQPTFPEATPEAAETTERAFREWNTLPASDREVLALAITRLSESLSRTGMLTEQDRALDVSIALEILYRLDRGEITHKLSTRAGWYLGNDLDDRIETRKAIAKFYDLRSQIIHGASAKRGRKQKRSTPTDEQQIREQAFQVARATLFRHLERGKVPAERDWSEIVMGADAAEQ